VLVGASATLPVQITNTGSSIATLTSLSATGDYSVANGSCPPPGSGTGGTLAAGATCALQVTFAPVQSGTHTGTLSLATSATTLPLTAALTGVGAQSHLQISPASVDFGAIAIGVPATQSLTLLNNGTVTITAITLATTGDYTVAVPCAVTTLAAGSSCSVALTFTPIAAGTRTGTLTVTSSDPVSPASVPLTGSGILNGTFTLTASGSSGASATVTSGSPATYNLAITPLNSFSGPVVLNCTPVVPAANSYCSLLPSSVTLTGTAQTAVATITTVTSIASGSVAMPGRRRTFGDTVLGLLFPAIIFTWKAGTSRHPAWRRVGPIAWAIFAAIALLSAGGCGGSSITPSNLRYAPAGTYQYRVTASSVSASAPITQTVTLNLTIR
jgi:hypothetical protein